MRILAAFFCLLLSAQSFAQNKTPAVKSSADAEKKIEALRREIKTLSKAQREVEEKRNQEAKQLRSIDQKVAVSSRSLNKIEGAIDGQEKKLDQLETEEQRLERNLREQKEQLAVLLRSAYRLGDNSELKHLLAQDKLSEAARWLAYHRYFEQERQKEIAGLSAQLEQLAAASLAVEQERRVLAQQKAQQQKAVAELSKQRQERSAAVSTLDAKYKTQQARIKALGKDEKALRGLLDKLRQAAAKSKAPAVVGRPSRSKPASKITPKNLTGWPLTGSLAGRLRQCHARRPEKRGPVDRRAGRRSGARRGRRPRGVCRLAERLRHADGDRSRPRLHEPVCQQRRIGQRGRRFRGGR